MSAATALRDLLSSGQTLVMPDAYDALSARIIAKMGFGAIQCSGFSMALATAMAEPAFGLERNLAVTTSIVDAVSIPVMADGEDGFGDVAAIPGTIRTYIAAGVGGINIEDQVLGVPGPRQLIPMEQAVEKLQVARQTAYEAGEPALILNARTDALPAAASGDDGLREAVRRANAYLQAGADLAFIIGVCTLDQVNLLVREVEGPISIAAGMPDNLGTLSIAQLRDAGVARVSLPSLMVFAAIRGMERALQSVQQTDGFDEIAAGEMLCGMANVARLLT